MPENTGLEYKEGHKVGASKSLNKSITDAMLICSGLESLIIDKNNSPGPLRQKFRNTLRSFIELQRDKLLTQKDNAELIKAFTELEKDFSKFSAIIRQDHEKVDVDIISNLFKRCGALLNEIEHRGNISDAAKKSKRKSLERAASEFLNACHEHKMHIFE